jgi:hypothetical protein
MKILYSKLIVTYSTLKNSQKQKKTDSNPYSRLNKREVEKRCFVVEGNFTEMDSAEKI